MPTPLSIDLPYDSPAEALMARIADAAERKDVQFTITGPREGKFVYKKLWATLLEGTFALTDDRIAITLTTTPPLMSETEVLAQVREKFAKLDRPDAGKD